MKGRGLLLGVLAWVAVVVAGSGVTWLVIDAAGQQVLTDGPVPLATAAPEPAGPGAQATGPTATLSAVPSHPTRPSTRPVPSPTAAVPPAPVASSPSPTRPPTTPAGQPAGPPAVERTWRGDAGTVVARCRDAAVSLGSATPGDGYGVQVGSRGPEDVEVTFAGGGRQLKVRAVCSAGEPRFTVESEGGDD